jgi:acetyl esterase/lipase
VRRRDFLRDGSVAAASFAFMRNLLAAPLRVAYGEAPQQFGELYVPPIPGELPVAVVIHGGFWKAAYGPLSLSLASAGLAVWNIEYRRVGDAGGGWPNTFLDVAAAADHVGVLAAPHRLDRARTVTIGHSAGGHLALWLAGRRRIKSGPLHSERPLRMAGAVSLAGVGDLARASLEGLGGGAANALMGGGPAALPERYAAGSPAALLPLGIPQVLVHGSQDPIVPFAFGQDYAALAKVKGDDVRLVTIEGAGHFEVIDPGHAAGKAGMAAVRKLAGIATPRSA